MQVTVHYLFSKNKKIGSYGIRALTKPLTETSWKKTPSHVAILVNNRWVHESTIMSGVRIISYKKWLKINTEIEKIPSKKVFDYSEIKKNFKKIKDLKYDWCGALYFGIHIIANILFKKPVPKENKWDEPDRYFCSEVVGNLLDLDFSMKSPVEIMVEINSI